MDQGMTKSLGVIRLSSQLSFLSKQIHVKIKAAPKCSTRLPEQRSVVHFREEEQNGPQAQKSHGSLKDQCRSGDIMEETQCSLVREWGRWK